MLTVLNPGPYIIDDQVYIHEQLAVRWTVDALS
jgi:hypothetical protein